MKAYTATIICCLSIISLFSGCIAETKQEGAEMKGKKLEFEINKTEEEWKEILTPEQFRILRKKGTERAFTGKYHDSKKEGIYVCAGCGNELFHSDAKFDSDTGWPSFWMPISENSIATQADKSLFMHRTEVLCCFT
jgi:peptide-methionine (R)-S-oxide reductase